MNPLLTIILIVDTEKDPELTEFFFYALRHWNRRAMPRVQVILITQKERDAHSLRVAARQPFPVDVVHANHETVAGYPLWDVCQEVRQVWPLVRGEYVTFAHQEFLTCPHRLEWTIEYLQMLRPTLALGNLRRPGIPEWGRDTEDETRAHSQRIEDLIRRRAHYLAGAAAEGVPNTHWLWWDAPPKPGESVWKEDIFFVRREWLQHVRFFWQEEGLVFQDVYDLMGTCLERLGRVGIEPDCIRLDQETHRAIHLWHPTPFSSFTPEIRDWFLADPERWGATTFGRADLWDRLVGRNGDTGWTGDLKALWGFRRGRGGTVARFAHAVDRWTRTPVGKARIARLA